MLPHCSPHFVELLTSLVVLVGFEEGDGQRKPGPKHEAGIHRERGAKFCDGFVVTVQLQGIVAFAYMGGNRFSSGLWSVIRLLGVADIGTKQQE